MGTLGGGGVVFSNDPGQLRVGSVSVIIETVLIIIYNAPEIAFVLVL